MTLQEFIQQLQALPEEMKSKPIGVWISDGYYCDDYKDEMLVSDIVVEPEGTLIKGGFPPWRD